MKAKTGNSKVVAKAVKAATVTKTVKVAKGGKAAAKVKPALKPAAKTPVKAVKKGKAAVKAAPKAAPKALPKPAGKPAARKAAPVKGPAKSPVQPRESKRGAKTVPKPVKTTVAKTVKSTAKVKKKESVKTTIDKAVKQKAAPAKVKVAPVVVAVKPAAAAPLPPASAAVPARAGRPSSRLAQLTVPSMAQSVASTAAKASYMQTQSSPMMALPVASAIKKDPKLANNWKSKSIEQISDAELIAMPDGEYMNEFQMAFFRRRLVQLKKDILSNAGETTEHLREDTVVVPDPADRATIEEEHALELRTRDRERKLLKKIEQSIGRIDAGDYGYCDETGEPIGVGRLLARPTANLSLEAQQRRELKQKMFGD